MEGAVLTPQAKRGTPDWQPVDGPRIYAERDLERPEGYTVAGARVALFTHRCPGAAQPNQDAVALFPCGEDAAVLAVADGVGGARSGGRAARLALETLGRTLESCAAADSLRAGVLNGFEEANRSIAELGIGAAATLLVVEYRAGALRPYHVGDSELAVVGQRGRVKLQTVSHTPSGYGLQAGLLSEREAILHEERHLLLNLLGAADMRIEVGPWLKLAARDTAVLGTDGVFDNWPVEEILDRVKQGPLDRAAIELAEETRRRMAREAPAEPAKPDDHTFVLLRRT